jgi:hypothetical protein
MNGSEKATKRQNQRLGETRGRERVKIQTCVLERILGSKNYDDWKSVPKR